MSKPKHLDPAHIIYIFFADFNYEQSDITFSFCLISKFCKVFKGSSDLINICMKKYLEYYI